MKGKAAFLDRDGIINEDYGYVSSWDKFRFKHFSKKGLLILQELGYKLIIVTNQSGIARGLFSESEYQKLTNIFLYKLQKSQINISSVYHCPHHPDFNKKQIHCNCRKPKPGMLLKAIKELNINVESSIIIGDKITDIKAGFNAGLQKRYLVSKNKSFNKLITRQFKSLFECALYLKSKDSNQNNYD